MITANSSGLNPRAFKPAVALRTSSRYWLHVRERHVPSASFQLCAGWSGTSRHVFSNIVSTVLPRASWSISAHNWKDRSEEHTSELQSPHHLLCPLLLYT